MYFSDENKYYEELNKSCMKGAVGKHLEPYKCYEIMHMCVLHMKKNYGLLDSKINDCFFYSLIPTLLSPCNR